MMGVLNTILAVFKAIPMFIAAAKALVSAWKQIQYDGRKKDFQEGTVERDQTKIEDSFDSDKAGKPSGHGTIVGPNE
jgi:hypothetical protein